MPTAGACWLPSGCCLSRQNDPLGLDEIRSCHLCHFLGIQQHGTHGRTEPRFGQRVLPTPRKTRHDMTHTVLPHLPMFSSARSLNARQSALAHSSIRGWAHLHRRAHTPPGLGPPPGTC
ncbi:hypothetical protein LY78DRAFT_309261 [Colletotrichum sublineola]|nr:hypothetical protein LY78DRAFT_309261 [Colletotrichum sublineola]